MKKKEEEIVEEEDVEVEVEVVWAWVEKGRERGKRIYVITRFLEIDKGESGGGTSGRERTSGGRGGGGEWVNREQQWEEQELLQIASGVGKDEVEEKVEKRELVEEELDEMSG